MIRVRTASRLHFGLFSLASPDDSIPAWPNVDGELSVRARAFGGVGLMVERPGLVVSAEPAAITELFFMTSPKRTGTP